VALLARRPSGRHSKAARISLVKLDWVGAGKELAVQLIRLDPVSEKMVVHGDTNGHANNLLKES
jgi:hypothetical protein